MREEEIRPAALMEQKRSCIEHDQEFLLDRQDRFVRVSCPACNGTNLTEAFAKLGFCYEECHDCETVLMNPRPGRELMGEFYETSANYDFWNKHIFPATEEARRESFFRPRTQRVQDICTKRGITGGVALEIGAGFGTFCEELRKLELFERIIALEPTPGLAKTCRGKGLETIQAPVEKCTIEQASVDLIACFEVIEHLFWPSDFLHHVSRLLKPSGLLVLSCPNVKGFDVATLGPVSNTFDHEHVNYFHPKSITQLCTQCGLTVDEVSTPGRLDAELVRKAVLAGGYDLSSQPFLKRVLIDQWDDLGSPFQQFLAAHSLSSHMWVVATRAS